MKVNIGKSAIIVKARSRFSNTVNQEDTIAFLNELSCLLDDAEMWNRENGYGAIADRAKEIGHAIYQKLDELGVYEEVRS